MQTSNQSIGESVLQDYFSAALTCFERATVLSGRRTQNYQAGPYSFRLDFAGPALESRLAPAFGHLATTGTTPNLQIVLWDTESTGITMPPPPWAWRAFSRNEVHIGNRIKIVYNGESGSLIMFDAMSRQGVYWIRQADNVPYYETGAPLLAVMHWWLASNSCQLVHAGAVGNEDGGVLLVGRGGSGKSTTALACLSGGLDFAADDYCVLTTGSDHVYSLYCSAKLAADSTRRLPGLVSAIHRPGTGPTEKTLFIMNRLVPERLSAGFPLHAILLPRVDGATATKLSPMPPARALRALAPSTIFQLAGAGGDAFQTLASIVRRVPCFEIAVGTDLSQIPAVIRRLLKTLSSPPHGEGASDV
jgi:hypothetical protein